MTPRLVAIGAAVLSGLVPGLLLAGTTGAVVGGTIGVGIGLLGDRFEVRTVVTASVTAATVTGAYIGRGIVSVICLPATCVALEILGALPTCAGAFTRDATLVPRAHAAFR